LADLVERILMRIAIVVVALIAVGAVIELTPSLRDRVQGWLSGVQTIPDQATIDDAEQALKDGNPSRALSIAKSVVARDSSQADVDLRAGDVAMSAGDNGSAEKFFLLGESADAHDPWDFVELGELYARENRYGDADAQLRAALNVAPNAQFLHYDLGVVELAENLNAAALEDFQAELKRTPGYAPAVTGRARALAALRLKPGQAVALGAVKSASVSPRVASPRPSPSVSASASPAASPGPTPQPTATPQPTSTPTPLPLATVAIPKPTRTPVIALVVAKHHVPVHHVRVQSTAVPTALPSPSLPPVHTPEPLADLASDAKSYLLGVGSDIGFTGALPDGDPSMPTAVIQSRIDDAKAGGGQVSGLLQAGSSALRSGRLTLALAAFDAASSVGPNDWRGPYCAALTDQADGNIASAREAFSTAVSRGGGPPAEVGLAIADLEDGDEADAYASAESAAQADPSYEPGRFTTGMLAIISADAPTAERELDAAIYLGSAPARTQYFLSAVRQREDQH
jgi:tetratricopeptide (TPR) repeat protein